MFMGEATRRRRVLVTRSVVVSALTLVALLVGAARPAAAIVATDDAMRAISGMTTTLRLGGNDGFRSPYRIVPLNQIGDPVPTGLNVPLQVTITTGNGSVVTGGAASSPDVGYVSGPGFVGTDSFYYALQPCTPVFNSPGDYQCGAVLGRATVTVTVEANQPPEAADDTADVRLETVIPVVDNDTDPNADLDQLTVSNTSGTTATGATWFCNGACVYKPTGTYTGPDEFSYSVVDRSGAADTATVHVNVTADGAPVAHDDEHTVQVGPDGNVVGSVFLRVYDNDTDPDGDPVTTGRLIDPPLHGTAQCGPDSCSYFPDSGVPLVDDSFTYRASDSLLESAPATVTVHLVGYNPPVAADDTVVVDPGTTTTIDVSANDAGPGAIESYEATSALGATVSCALGQCSYTIGAALGQDTFRYFRSDGLTTATGTVTITIRNLPPVALGQISRTSPDTPVAIDLHALASDPNGEPVTVTPLAVPAHGTVSCAGLGCTYTPSSGYVGQDELTYQAVDPEGLQSSPATVTVTVDPAGGAAGVLVPGQSVIATAAPTAAHPLQTRVEGGSATGPVTIVEQPPGPPPAGYALFGQESVITAPAASVTAPLILTFDIDGSVVPVGITTGDLVVFRNGVPVPVCSGLPDPPRADPSPCLARRSANPVTGGFNVQVYTAAASRWSFGRVQPTGLTVALKAAAVTPATAKRQSAVAASGTFSLVSGATATCGDPVSLSVAGLNQTIAGSRFRTIAGVCTAVSTTGPFTLVAIDFKRGLWSVAGSGTAPTVITNPVAFALTIGDDTGSTTANLTQRGGIWRYPG